MDICCGYKIKVEAGIMSDTGHTVCVYSFTNHLGLDVPPGTYVKPDPAALRVCVTHDADLGLPGRELCAHDDVRRARNWSWFENEDYSYAGSQAAKRSRSRRGR